MRFLVLMLVMLLVSCKSFTYREKYYKYKVTTENRLYYTNSVDEKKNNCLSFTPELSFRDNNEDKLLKICGSYTITKLNNKQR